jgi:DNA repair ATPase RecN
MLDDELALLGYSPDDVGSLENVDQCLRALGYTNHDIMSGSCLTKLPENVMQVDAYKAHISSLLQLKKGYEQEILMLNHKIRTIQREVDQLLQFQEERKNSMLNVIRQHTATLSKFTEKLQQLHQQVNYMHLSVVVIPNNPLFTECRDKLMEQRMELVFQAMNKTVQAFTRTM